MTVARVMSDLLMWAPSLRRVPSLPVWRTRSEPARSTKFCLTAPYGHDTTAARHCGVWSYQARDPHGAIGAVRGRHARGRGAFPTLDHLV
jgi:hypothetical protein